MAMTVDADYPGGNILLQRIDGDRIVVRQDQRDTPEWWFWWNFRLRGAARKTIRVEFDDPRGGAVGPNGPVVRLSGRPWRWAENLFDKSYFVHHVPAEADEVYFAFSFPYQLADLERFIAANRGHPDFQATVLTTTAAGRPAPLITIGRPAQAGRNVLLACRHHCCEAVASYVLEGTMEFLLSPDGEQLRRSTGFTIVPLVDLDGVEAGDQGKSRAPHDHNRDYLDQPLYPTVRATKELVANLARRNLVIYIDYHCPWIRGTPHLAIFFAEPPEPYAAHLREFGRILRRVNDSPLPCSGKFDVPHGTSWNVPALGLMSSTGFVRQAGGPGLRFATTLETSYSIAEGAIVRPDAARHFGRAVGQALADYLEPARS